MVLFLPSTIASFPAEMRSRTEMKLQKNTNIAVHVWLSVRILGAPIIRNAREFQFRAFFTHGGLATSSEFQNFIFGCLHKCIMYIMYNVHRSTADVGAPVQTNCFSSLASVISEVFLADFKLSLRCIFWVRFQK